MLEVQGDSLLKQPHVCGWRFQLRYRASHISSSIQYLGIELYPSDYGKISSWTVVEFHNTEKGLRISMNGDHLATADIESRPFPGIWFHLGEGNNKAEIDYILFK